MRSDEKPLQIELSSLRKFRTQANRSYPEGNRLLLCISTGERLWRSPTRSAKRKTSKDVTK